MDVLQETSPMTKNAFFNHVFSSNDEDKAEFLNVVQYASLGVIPIVLLNKTIQRFIPEADTEKSSLELLAEIFIQLVIIFCGVILIHRIITYIPTYSGFKYENLALTNVILSFLVIVLSIQTKLGIKANILFDRMIDLWEGTTSDSQPSGGNRKKAVSSGQQYHSPSQADNLDNSIMQNDMFPPAPVSTTTTKVNVNNVGLGGGQSRATMNANTTPYAEYSMGPAPANSVLGNSFGSF